MYIDAARYTGMATLRCSARGRDGRGSTARDFKVTDFKATGGATLLA
jgi:hypothetical protein